MLGSSWERSPDCASESRAAWLGRYAAGEGMHRGLLVDARERLAQLSIWGVVYLRKGFTFSFSKFCLRVRTETAFSIPIKLTIITWPASAPTAGARITR